MQRLRSPVALAAAPRRISVICLAVAVFPILEITVAAGFRIQPEHLRYVLVRSMTNAKQNIPRSPRRFDSCSSQTRRNSSGSSSPVLATSVAISNACWTFEKSMFAVSFAFFSVKKSILICEYARYNMYGYRSMLITLSYRDIFALNLIILIRK